MAKSLTQTLTLTRLGRHLPPKSRPPSSRLLTLRAQSNQSSSIHDLNEIDSSSSNTDPLIRKLEDAIHRIIVRRSAPDWLPFLPGSSYWVPPPRSSSNTLAQLLDKLANPLTEEESMSVTTVRGWPSSAYFIQGATPVEVEALTASNTVFQSEVEEPSSCESESVDEEG
ncbi:Serine/arginine repetitive matrix protein 2, putative isoform 2 [Quillaja saponaria]|uniref:Serine/arginine repetitive matrix protein 2, putative isoform 2 n=1 Tax=Quillaja saponaria TaxID=32244 RepID=A0AAD7LSM0_QUISA|nr:Serine/arginine repetitive matrix protein 2, putative isoform 2 [Quillaja saponaria]